MSLIRFRETQMLAFVQGPDIVRVTFRAGEFAEVDVERGELGSCTLRRTDGYYAPWVSEAFFEELPKGFELFQLAQTVNLTTGTYSPEHDSWLWDAVATERYNRGSVHAFKVLDTPLCMPGFAHLQMLDGRILPGVYEAYFVGRKFTPKKTQPQPTTSKRVLEAFPAPVPGVQGIHCGAWSCPRNFNSLAVVRDGDVPSSLLDCPEAPVAYLRLAEGDGRRYDKLYYRCSYFGAPVKV